MRHEKNLGGMRVATLKSGFVAVSSTGPGWPFFDASSCSCLCDNTINAVQMRNNKPQIENVETYEFLEVLVLLLLLLHKIALVFVVLVHFTRGTEHGYIPDCWDSTLII